MPTRSYLSQSELPVTIGLGKSDQVHGVEIIWPGGAKQTLAGLKIDTTTTVEEGR